jgi:hypothetical protein
MRANKIYQIQSMVKGVLEVSHGEIDEFNNKVTIEGDRYLGFGARFESFLRIKGGFKVVLKTVGNYNEDTGNMWFCRFSAVIENEEGRQHYFELAVNMDGEVYEIGNKLINAIECRIAALKARAKAAA